MREGDDSHLQSQGTSARLTESITKAQLSVSLCFDLYNSPLGQVLVLVKAGLLLFSSIQDHNPAEKGGKNRMQQTPPVINL